MTFAVHSYPLRAHYPAMHPERYEWQVHTFCRIFKKVYNRDLHLECFPLP